MGKAIIRGGFSFIDSDLSKRDRNEVFVRLLKSHGNNPQRVHAEIESATLEFDNYYERIYEPMLQLRRKKKLHNR